jgi:hypothetical protein
MARNRSNGTGGRGRVEPFTATLGRSELAIFREFRGPEKPAYIQDLLQMLMKPNDYLSGIIANGTSSGPSITSRS